VLFDGSKVIVRPSGTEPKIKFYVLSKGSKANNARTDTDSFFNMAREELTCQSKTVEQEILNSPIV
jgi:phosphomannomutase